LKAEFTAAEETLWHPPLTPFLCVQKVLSGVDFGDFLVCVNLRKSAAKYASVSTAK
jgi:hypothetical protein